MGTLLSICRDLCEDEDEIEQEEELQMYATERKSSSMAKSDSNNSKNSQQTTNTSSSTTSSAAEPIPMTGTGTGDNNSSSSAELSSNGLRTDFNENFLLQDVIGTGSTSVCYKSIRKSDGKEFACKVIDKKQIEMKFSGLLDQFYIEIKVLQMLKHPNIIFLQEAFDTPDRIYIIMETMQGGELFDYVVEKGTLSEEEASVLVRKITSAVAHMHERDIIHRDLKPENLLLTSKGPKAEVKLIDFGLAKVMQEDTARSFLGTRGYLAPEMLQRSAYNKSIDVWALGIIVFVLLCGCLPFDDDSAKVSEQDAKKKFALRFPRWAMNISNSAKDLLQKLLDIDPKTRLTAQQALAHPWVQGKSASKGYLASPGKIGERRKELMSPKITPQVRKNIIKEDRGEAGTGVTSIASGGVNLGIGMGGGGRPRKNSI